MSYWSTLYPFSNDDSASNGVESAAKWVQWAMAGISDEGQTRYNLSQFWSEKMAAYPAASARERTQYDRLDMTAHGILDALETGLAYEATPGYVEYWRAYLFGGTPPRPETAEHALAAKKAAMAAASAANSAGLPSVAAYFSNVAERDGQIVEDTDALWKQQGVTIGGVPLMLILASIAALGLYFATRRR